MLGVTTGSAILVSAFLVWTMPEGCGLGDAHSGAAGIVGLQGLAYINACVTYAVYWAIRERKLIAAAWRAFFNR